MLQVIFCIWSNNSLCVTFVFLPLCTVPRGVYSRRFQKLWAARCAILLSRRETQRRWAQTDWADNVCGTWVLLQFGDYGHTWLEYLVMCHCLLSRTSVYLLCRLSLLYNTPITEFTFMCYGAGVLVKEWELHGTLQYAVKCSRTADLGHSISFAK